MDTLKINRKITSSNLRIDELKAWVGREVEIIIKEKDSSSKKNSGHASASGMLEDFANQELIEKENTGWISAIREKYGDR